MAVLLHLIAKHYYSRRKQNRYRRKTGLVSLCTPPLITEYYHALVVLTALSVPSSISIHPLSSLPQFLIRPPSRSCDFLRRWITRSRQEPRGCLACICIIVHANSMQTTCRKVTVLRRPCNFNCNFASLNLSSESKSRQVSLTCKFILDVCSGIVN